MIDRNTGHDRDEAAGVPLSSFLVAPPDAVTDVGDVLALQDACDLELGLLGLAGRKHPLRRLRRRRRPMTDPLIFETVFDAFTSDGGHASGTF